MDLILTKRDGKVEEEECKEAVVQHRLTANELGDGTEEDWVVWSVTKDMMVMRRMAVGSHYRQLVTTMCRHHLRQKEILTRSSAESHDEDGDREDANLFADVERLDHTRIGVARH